MKNKMKGLWIGMGISLLCLSGCKFVKEPDVGDIQISDEVDLEGVDTIITPSPTAKLTPTVEATPTPEVGEEDIVFPTPDISPIVTPPITQNAVTVAVDKRKGFDDRGVLEFFYGESREELVEGNFLDLKISQTGKAYSSFETDKDGKYLQFVYQGYLYFEDMNERAGNAYKDALIYKFFKNEFSNHLMELYPEGELETCSREDVLEACAPLAEACGYGDAQVSVCVMKSDILNSLGYLVRRNEKKRYTAPNPDFDYDAMIEEANKLYEQEMEAREQGNEELAEKLSNERIWLEYGIFEPDIEWTEEMDAYLLVYRSVVNGRVLDSVNHQLWCVYVPHYGRVVYAEGRPALYATETQEEVELISKEDALQEVLRTLNMTTEDGITITGMSIVYSPRKGDWSENIIHPSWRIDYTLSDAVYQSNPDLWLNDDWTILIDAVDGRETLY